MGAEPSSCFRRALAALGESPLGGAIAVILAAEPWRTKETCAGGVPCPVAGHSILTVAGSNWIFGNLGSMSSSASSTMSATTRFRYHFLFAGTMYHGAHF